MSSWRHPEAGTRLTEGDWANHIRGKPPIGVRAGARAEIVCVDLDWHEEGYTPSRIITFCHSAARLLTLKGVWCEYTGGRGCHLWLPLDGPRPIEEAIQIAAGCWWWLSYKDPNFPEMLNRPAGLTLPLPEDGPEILPRQNHCIALPGSKRNGVDSKLIRYTGGSYPREAAWNYGLSGLTPKFIKRLLKLADENGNPEKEKKPEPKEAAQPGREIPETARNRREAIGRAAEEKGLYDQIFRPAGNPNGDGWQLVFCPIHEDKSPSGSLNRRTAWYVCRSTSCPWFHRYAERGAGIGEVVTWLKAEGAPYE